MTDTTLFYGIEVNFKDFIEIYLKVKDTLPDKFVKDVKECDIDILSKIRDNFDTYDVFNLILETVSSDDESYFSDVNIVDIAKGLICPCGFSVGKTNLQMYPLPVTKGSSPKQYLVGCVVSKNPVKKTIENKVNKALMKLFSSKEEDFVKNHVSLFEL